MNPRTKLIKEYAEAIIIALFLALFIRTFVVQAFKIPSGSMLNTLLIGDQLLVEKYAYDVKLPYVNLVLMHMSDPQRGDIIVFEFPNRQETEHYGKDFIKRVIGVPGDTIEMRDKVVYRNGQPLDEPYTRHAFAQIIPNPVGATYCGRSPVCRDNFPAITVPEGKYFVMGDNRDESYDSRFWGLVNRSDIRGKAWVIYWSWNSLTDIRWGRIGHLVQKLGQ